MIIGRTKKQPNNIIIIKQRKSNIEREFEIMIRNLKSFINVTDSIIISLNINQEKERDLNLICSGNIKIEKLSEILQDNVINNRKSYQFYTDGSLKQIDNNIVMAIGWIQVESINSKKIIAEFNAANIEWPSSTKAEIIAILSALLVVTSNSNVVIYTDSQNAITQYNCYKSELSFKRKLKITGYLIWEIILYLTTKYNIES